MFPQTSARARERQKVKRCSSLFSGEFGFPGIESGVLGALVTIALFLNQDPLDEKRCRIGDEDAPHPGRRIAQGRRDHHVPGISEQEFEMAELLNRYAGDARVTSRLPPRLSSLPSSGVRNSA
jgi:hypothetical protein